MGCCLAGPESQPDEGALLSQLCSVLKDYEGLEEIDKMLGIPTLAGQVRLKCIKPGESRRDQDIQVLQCRRRFHDLSKTKQTDASALIWYLLSSGSSA